jgi:predicted dehydrogenase
MSMYEPVRWGVLSTARFAINRWLPSFTSAPGVRGIAIASRELERAKKTADTFGFAKAYGSYEELLTEPSIEAVYIPLPNGLHGKWALAAIAAGKHVLVEKPAWANADEARRVAVAANASGIRVMEAFMVRHHARWKRVMELVAEGAIGDVKAVAGAFCFTLDDAANVRWDPALAGGALADVGCYPVNAARLVFGGEPVEVFGVAVDTHDTGVDSSFSGTLTFPAGEARFVGSFERPFEQSLRITGTRGDMSLNRPFICRDEPVTITITTPGGKARVEHVALGDQYVDEITHFSACVRDPAKPLWPGEDGVASAVVLDALRESARSGRPVRL